MLRKGREQAFDQKGASPERHSLVAFLCYQAYPR